MNLSRIAVALSFCGLVAEASAQALTTPAAAPEPLIDGRVKGDRARRLLEVDIAWPLGLKPVFPRDDGAVVMGRYTARVGAAGTTLQRIEDVPDWAGSCQHQGCRLAYTVDMGRAIGADQRGDRGFEERQGIILAPLSRWLVRPEDLRARGRLHLEFDGGKGFELVSGVMDGRVNRVEADLMMIDGPHVVLGEFTHKSIDVAGGRIDVAIGKGTRQVSDDEVLAWIREGAADVVALMGRFPISRLQVIVASGGPYAVGSAITMGMGGASIFVVVGQGARRADLLRDWVMTHEMLHVAFPNMGPLQGWMEEGLSTYLEPLLRARRGRQEPRLVWAEFLRAMPQGLPREGDQGLDANFTWGRRYWGGALFWLHVDVEIRKRTGGERSLDDLMRAIQASGGNIASRWDVARLASVAEGATGTTALREAYDVWARQAVSPDLGALWSSLGVKADKAERITFDDHAPLSEIRKKLTSPSRAAVTNGRAPARDLARERPIAQGLSGTFRAYKTRSTAPRML